MPRDLNLAQIALLLSIDDASAPRSPLGGGLLSCASVDRTRLARDGFIACRRRTSRAFWWSTTTAGKLRAERARAEAAERRADLP